VSTNEITPGERFHDRHAWTASEVDGPNIWKTLGYRRLAWEPGSTTIEWTAIPEYCFLTAEGHVVQGGLVTALLDAAMGGACWTVLDRDQVFLTADLRIEFLRTSRPGVLRAIGSVVRRTRRVVFCSAEMFDVDTRLLAVGRCTQLVLPNEGPFGRHLPADALGAPPKDARG